MRLVPLALLLLALATPARALDEADRSAARSVIERQLQAFGADDAAGAYAHAAPSIRRLFPDPDRFIEMVRRGYPPVYRPRSHRFEESREIPEGVAQAVRIQDEAGVDWIALYTLERQPDGTWQITGCQLLKAPGEVA